MMQAAPIYENERMAGLYRGFRLNAQANTDELMSLLLRENRSFAAKLDSAKRQLQADAWERWALDMGQLTKHFRHTGIWPDQLEAQIIADREQRLAVAERHARHDCLEAILGGELGRGLITPGPHSWNKVTTGYLKATIGARMCAEHTSNEDAILRYIAVGTGNNTPSDSDTSLTREIFRGEPDTQKNTDSGSKFTLRLDFDDANPDTETTVIGIPTPTTTAIAVASTAGFAAGDAIYVPTSPVTSVSRIQSIGSGVLNLAIPLASVPAVSTPVKLMIGSVGGFGNLLATATPDSGTLFSHAQLPILKEDDTPWYLKITYIRLAV